jgi:hypothetical protein
VLPDDRLLDDRLRPSKGPKFSPSSFLFIGFYEERLFLRVVVVPAAPTVGIAVIEEASMASLRLARAF